MLSAPGPVLETRAAMRVESPMSGKSGGDSVAPAITPRPSRSKKANCASWSTTRTHSGRNIHSKGRSTESCQSSGSASKGRSMAELLEEDPV